MTLPSEFGYPYTLLDIRKRTTAFSSSISTATIELLDPLLSIDWSRLCRIFLSLWFFLPVSLLPAWLGARLSEFLYGPTLLTLAEVRGAIASSSNGFVERPPLDSQSKGLRDDDLLILYGAQAGCDDSGCHELEGSRHDDVSDTRRSMYWVQEQSWCCLWEIDRALIALPKSLVKRWRLFLIWISNILYTRVPRFLGSASACSHVEFRRNTV